MFRAMWKIGHFV
uniref:Uncharacterized protein n=1 Tax=Lepeophtheirus salmonis TaxID=72036 RepID=A0A0K2T4C5_LEPSM